MCAKTQTYAHHPIQHSRMGKYVPYSQAPEPLKSPFRIEFWEDSFPCSLEILFWYKWLKSLHVPLILEGRWTVFKDYNVPLISLRGL